MCEQVMVPSSDDGFDPPRPPPRFGWFDGSMKSATDTAKQDRTVQVAGEIESYKELASSSQRSATVSASTHDSVWQHNASGNGSMTSS
jgi:hypothetical protein